MPKRDKRKPGAARKSAARKPGRKGLLDRALAGEDLPAQAEADAALAWCYGVTRATLLFKEKTVSPGARKAWFDHYGPRFTDAIVKHGRHLKNDILHLSARSVVLGQRAADYAGADAVVSEEAARKAIKDVSCEKLKFFLHWCPA